MSRFNICFQSDLVVYNFHMQQHVVITGTLFEAFMASIFIKE